MTKNTDSVVKLDNYRCMVGKILYYTTKIAPDCANAIRELSQHMSNPGIEHWQALDRLVGYMKGKGEHTLIYRKPTEYRSISYVDLNYATNVETRKSVTGMINTIGGMITHWSSKTQSTVTLSSTEAEYIALSAC